MPNIDEQEQERIRRQVNKMVSHIDDPAKRAKMIRVLTRQLSVLAAIPDEATADR